MTKQSSDIEVEESVFEDLLVELEKQTSYLEKINGKLNFMYAILIVFIILTIFNALLSFRS